MISKRNFWKWGFAAAAVAVYVFCAGSVNHLIFAVRATLSLQKLAAGQTMQTPDILESKAHRRIGDENWDALVYSPAGSPAKSAVILVAGLSEQGCYHPRLIGLSRLLADNGFLVVTPDIREFRDFRITAEPVRQILFWYKEIPKLNRGAEVRKTGLAGISFSATLALIAASRAEIRDSVGFVAGIGAYSDLSGCTRGWFAADRDAAPKNYYPTRFYAKWIVMRAALDMVESEKDRLFLRQLLDDLLLQKQIPPADPGLTPEAQRWYALAVMKENETDADLAGRIERHLVAGIFSQVDPSQALPGLRCPVFLIHGAYDDLIPARESEELHREIQNSYLLLSPFLTHTHPTDQRLSPARKLRAALDTVIFCYHFSQAAR
jgi:pimeloyl-ACP methyl ester carboxylesterase